MTCVGFHGPHHGDRIDDLYHDCDVHHDHKGADAGCPYYLITQAAEIGDGADGMWDGIAEVAKKRLEQ